MMQVIRRVLLFAGLAVSLIGGATLPVDAQDNTVKQIAPDDALLDVGLSGRALVGVKAGYYANKLYVEKWQFDNSALNFQKLSGHTYFSTSSFSEKRSLQRYCGEEPELNCSEVETKRHSKNLISVVYQSENGGAVCAGLDYIDEDGRATGRRPRMYGNYIVSMIHCRRPGSDPDEVLAHSANYLAAAKKDGRFIVNLGHYDLPKLVDPAAPAPSK
jgi:hypothetical protein